jgi:hypothetical protein
VRCLRWLFVCSHREQKPQKYLLNNVTRSTDCCSFVTVRFERCLPKNFQNKVEGGRNGERNGRQIKLKKKNEYGRKAGMRQM